MLMQLLYVHDNATLMALIILIKAPINGLILHHSMHHQAGNQYDSTAEHPDWHDMPILLHQNIPIVTVTHSLNSQTGKKVRMDEWLLIAIFFKHKLCPIMKLLN